MGDTSGSWRTIGLDVANPNLNPTQYHGRCGWCYPIHSGHQHDGDNVLDLSAFFSTTPAPLIPLAPYAMVKGFCCHKLCCQVSCKAPSRLRWLLVLPPLELDQEHGVWHIFDLEVDEGKGRMGRRQAGPGVRRWGTRDKDTLAPGGDDVAGGTPYAHLEDYQETHAGEKRRRGGNSEGYGRSVSLFLFSWNIDVRFTFSFQ